MNHVVAMPPYFDDMHTRKKYHVHFCTLITWIFWVDGTACSKLEVFFHRWWSWVRDQHTSKTESPVWCNASSRCRSTLPYCLGSYTYAPQKPTGRKIGDYSNNCPNHSTVRWCKHIFVLCNNNHLLTWGGFFIQRRSTVAHFDTVALKCPLCCFHGSRPKK